MRTLVYIISDHEEGGATNVQATLDPTKLRGMVEHHYAECVANFLKHPPRHCGNDEAAKAAWCAEVVKRMGESLAADLAGLQRLIEAGLDSLLGREGGLYLESRGGWGGLQIHVVALEQSAP